MKRHSFRTLVATAALAASGAALADVTIGVIAPLTGPASGLGIPVGNHVKLWPKEIAGQKVNVIVMDDATDPTNGVKIAKRFVAEDKVDVIMGSVATPVAAAISQVAEESGTAQIAWSPVALPSGKDKWVFRLPQSNAVMSHAVIEHMKKQGIKSVGFLGYSDAYGETWLVDFKPMAEKAGIQVGPVERFARADTSVTGQALKLVSANPQAILVVASGSGAAMPEMALRERNYKGTIYQTHAAATRDLMRVGGKAVEGTFVVSGPAVLAEQLPDSHPSKGEAIKYVQQYEKAYGPGSRNQFAAHAYDSVIIMEKALPIALKTAKPGTPEFRAALRDAFEQLGRTVLSHGVLNWTAQDHWGYAPETGVMMKVVDGQFKVEK
ncbi:MAG TPA: ABC transporter substrate-binding protein [Ottowia sp.]|uniref:ABC transporter substrate-binding protein n=1 Tax=Ottowia sp. TaxID=1898956 RepID=UPI002CFB89D5|nr:ABC transporter substrate-binding protein [Ottowia sp.]MCZ2089861.1 ABC transporter substrate-binding protein [Burkholderiales bacterium]HNR82529.1 ABC transporter substrate-binding protein [Ottowia sp.]HOZ93466.1 ABC transporter substrate-binding protein [Ottowia sp.]HQO54047.1 ABC transporter substrate-binding protein [Ottowia sp.]HQQ52906.1 ABC transporter substrate-binding protein [Ottowia sp.]